MCIFFTGDGFHNFVLKCSIRISGRLPYLMHLEWVDLLTKLQDINLGPSHPLNQCWYVENSPAQKWRFGHWKMNVFFQGVIFRFQALVVWGNTCPNKKVGSVCVCVCFWDVFLNWRLATVGEISFDQSDMPGVFYLCSSTLHETTIATEKMMLGKLCSLFRTYMLVKYRILTCP